MHLGSGQVFLFWSPSPVLVVVLFVFHIFYFFAIPPLFEVVCISFSAGSV